MAKLTFNEVLERINDQRSVSRQDVLASALDRVVWVAEWHIPCCLSESQSYCTSKKDAIECACSMAEGEEGIPSGMKTSLIKFGRFDSHSEIFGTCINTVSKMRLSDIL